MFFCFEPVLQDEISGLHLLALRCWVSTVWNPQGYVWWFGRVALWL